jgi:Domain of unknown function (DUF5122) beta-propeller
MKVNEIVFVGPNEPSLATSHSSARRRTRGGLALLLALCLSLALPGLAAATDGGLDPTFSNFTGVSKLPIIRGQANYQDSNGYANGYSLIFGYFTSLTDGNGTHSVNSIARLTDFTGTVDTGFQNPSNPHPWTINGEVRGAILGTPGSSTSDIILWGAFTLTDTTTSKIYYNLARLIWNTTDAAYVVDTSFPVIFKQGGLVHAVGFYGTYPSNSQVLVGGYNLQPVLGAANTIYHLIRLNANFTYDTNYTARSLPGGYVTRIGFNASNYPVIFGTLPLTTGHVDWWEKLNTTDWSSVLKSLGDLQQIDGPIFSMAQTSTNGPWIIVGTFKYVYGTPLNHVAQLTSDLSDLDNITNNFNTGIGTGADHAVQQIYIYGNGQPVLAGGLTSFNGAACGHLVRLNTDGTVDIGFNYSGGNPTAGADDRIFKLFSFQTSSTQSYFGITGAFQNYNGTTRSGIATLNMDHGSLYTGSYASPFAANSNTPGTVYAVDTEYVSNGVSGQSEIIIGGDFTGVNGKYRQNLAFLNLDGSLDTTHSSLVFEGPVKSIRGIEGSNGFLVAGNFGQAQGYGCTGLVRLNSDASRDLTFLPLMTQTDGTVADIHSVDTDDNISGDYDIMGKFANIFDKNTLSMWSGSPAFARLHSDGSPDTTFTANINITGGSNIYVNAGGSMGADYGMVGYVNYNDGTSHDYGFACVLDSTGVTTIASMLFDGEVLCANGHGGKASGGILVGGNFTHADILHSNLSRNHIAALNSDFTLDTSSFAGAGADGPIYALETNGQNDTGKPIIGGAFSHYNGVGRNNVARLNLDGSLDNSFNPGAGPNGPVYALNWTNQGSNGSTVGKAILGGAFGSYNGTTMPGVAVVQASMGVNTAPINLLLLMGN